jgi:hypothetical protein
VILEGVIGRAFKQDETLHAYQTEWRKVFDRLSPQTQQALRADPLPFAELGDIAVRWGAYIQQKSYLGSIPLDSFLGERAFNLDRTIDQISSKDPERVKLIHAEIAASEFPGFGDTFSIIGCREIFANFPATPVLSQGELVGIGNLCERRKLETPFDSKDWPMKGIPVYYFQGTSDSATPLWQAQYHYAQNPSGPKTFVTVGEASHEPLHYSLFAAGCKKAALTSVLSGGSDLEAVLRSCRWSWPIAVARH